MYCICELIEFSIKFFSYYLNALQERDEIIQNENKDLSFQLGHAHFKCP